MGLPRRRASRSGLRLDTVPSVESRTDGVDAVPWGCEYCMGCSARRRYSARPVLLSVRCKINHVRPQMRGFSHLVALTFMAVALLGCTNPDIAAQRDNASLEELSRQGASIASMRVMLVDRKYECTNRSGTFTPPDGAPISVPRYVQCTRTTGDGLFCNYRVEVTLVPLTGGGTGTYFGRQSLCL